MQKKIKETVYNSKKKTENFLITSYGRGLPLPFSFAQIPREGQALPLRHKTYFYKISNLIVCPRTAEKTCTHYHGMPAEVLRKQKFISRKYPCFFLHRLFRKHTVCSHHTTQGRFYQAGDTCPFLTAPEARFHFFRKAQGFR